MSGPGKKKGENKSQKNGRGPQGRQERGWGGKDSIAFRDRSAVGGKINDQNDPKGVPWGGGKRGPLPLWWASWVTENCWGKKRTEDWKRRVNPKKTSNVNRPGERGGKKRQVEGEKLD